MPLLLPFWSLLLCEDWYLCRLPTGKKKEDVENFINEGVHQVERMKDEGFITDIKYEDEVFHISFLEVGIDFPDKFLCWLNLKL